MQVDSYLSLQFFSWNFSFLVTNISNNKTSNEYDNSKDKAYISLNLLNIAKYPGNEDKVRKMAIIYDGQVKMAHLAICAGFSVNGVARLHTEILKNQELKDFYEMMPENDWRE